MIESYSSSKCKGNTPRKHQTILILITLITDREQMWDGINCILGPAHHYYDPLLLLLDHHHHHHDHPLLLLLDHHHHHHDHPLLLLLVGGW